MTKGGLLLAVIGICLTGMAGAQTVCRPNALGGQTCTGRSEPRPLPRPPLWQDEDGLAEVRRNHPDPDTGPQVIPARKTNRLGSTLPGRPVAGGGARCRADRLGNTICR